MIEMGAGTPIGYGGVPGVVGQQIHDGQRSVRRWGTRADMTRCNARLQVGGLLAPTLFMAR